MKVKFLAVLTIAVALFISACGKSDVDLTKAVNDKLAADKVTGVTATVKDGVATLTGEVADVTVKTKAETSAKSVEGIKSVVSTGVTPKPLPSATPSAPDPALIGKINESLKKAGCSTATVTVTNGKVTVSGEVPAAKYAECVQAVMQSGITGIDNKLTKGK